MSVPLPLYIKEPIVAFFKKLSFGSVRVAYYYAATIFANDFGLSLEKKKRIHKKQQKCLRNWLYKKYGYVAKAELPRKIAEHTDSAPIWIFWWQGIESAPELVQLCVKSIENNSSGHPVILISAENYREYVSIPEHIIRKQENGSISLTHFSDVIRMNLLADHGGLWLDATIFVSRPIPSYWFTQPIYTGKNPGEDYTNISDWNWTSYALATQGGNELVCRMVHFFNEYWKRHDSVVDYFLMDCAIDMMYMHCSNVKKDVNAIPRNNTRQHELNEMFYRVHDNEKYEYLLCSSDTFFHKLTWKASYPELTEDGKETAFCHWKHEMNL